MNYKYDLMIIYKSLTIPEEIMKTMPFFVIVKLYNVKNYPGQSYSLLAQAKGESVPKFVLEFISHLLLLAFVRHLETNLVSLKGQ